MLELNFSFPLNVSVQVGDFLFAVPTTTNSGYVTAANEVQSSNLVGVISSIQNRNTNNSKIIINNPNFTPVDSDFIMFAKDNIVNANSLKGYYAEVTFVNDSDEKAELFGVTAEVQQSSK